MISWCARGWVVVAMQLLVATSMHADSPAPTTQEILNRCERGSLPLHRFTAIVNSSYQWSRSENGAAKAQSSPRWQAVPELRVDGERVFTKSTFKDTRGQTTDDRIEERTFGMSETFQCQLYPKDRSHNWVRVSHRAQSGHYELFEKTGMLLGGFSYNDERPIWQLLAESSDLRIVPPPTGLPVACDAVAGKTPLGIVTLCIGKSDGIARLITFEKTKGDLDEQGNVMGDDDPLYEGDAPLKQTITWDNVKVQVIDGQAISVAGRLTVRSDYLRDGTTQSVQTFELQKVNLKPDFSSPAEFRPDIPEGTKVYDNENWRTQLVWHKGQVIKRSDLRAALEGQKPLGSIWKDWRVLVLLMLIAMTVPVLMASWYVRWRKPKVA
jgi:hypothetical protein